MCPSTGDINKLMMMMLFLNSKMCTRNVLREIQ
jgi:hypothetical protein